MIYKGKVIGGLIDLYTLRSGRGIYGNIYRSITFYPNLPVGKLNKIFIYSFFIVLETFLIIKYINIKP